MDLLHQWKKQRERKALEGIKGIHSPTIPMQFIPHLEADLLWNCSRRFRKEMIIRDPNIIRNPPNLSEIYKFEFNWELTWDYVLVIYNNSSYLAKNIQIKNIGVSIPLSQTWNRCQKSTISLP